MRAWFNSHLLEQPFLGQGFRPFFLLAAIQATTSILLWTAFHAGAIAQPSSFFADPVLWHAHEMIFGFVMPVIAGFLLTAALNWTGPPGRLQWTLLLLSSIWLAGRVGMNSGSMPLWLSAFLDCSFVPALAVSLLILVRTGKLKKLIFSGLLTAIACCDVSFFVWQSRFPLHVAVLIIIAMISLVGGRLFPSFAIARLRQAGREVYLKEQPAIEKAAFVAILATIICFMLKGAESPLTGSLSLVAAMLHVWRIRSHNILQTLWEPMLWILNAGYLWLIIGLVLLGLVGFSVLPLTIAMHSLTVGCIGSECIGMMCRVTLGHSGRRIIARPATLVAFILMQLAAIIRVVGPALLPDHYLIWIETSGVLWASTFALYLFSYAPILVNPWVGGKPF